MVKTILQLLFIAAIAALVFVYYALVLPNGMAGVMALLVTCVMAVSLLMGKMEIKTVLFGSAAFAAWPAGAMIADAAFSAFGAATPPAVARALAPLAAVLAGHFAYTWAEKRDRARDIALSSISIIVLYTLVAAVYSGDRFAVACACLCVAVGCAAAKQQMIVPPEHERFLFVATCISGGVALFHFVLALLF